MDVVHLALILDPAHEVRKGVDVFLKRTPKYMKSVPAIWRHKRAALRLIDIQHLKMTVFNTVCEQCGLRYRLTSQTCLTNDLSH